jgi:hypothetical protein
MNKQEHPDLSDIEWDPTGRYITSSVNMWNAKVSRHTTFIVLGSRPSVLVQRDHSFKIWTFQGNLVFEKTVERLVAFHWRCRPPTLLMDEMIKVIDPCSYGWTCIVSNVARRMFVEIVRYGRPNWINAIEFYVLVNQRNNKNNGDDNSMNFNDSKTRISNDWQYKSSNVFNFVRASIPMRSANKAHRMFAKKWSNS